MTTLDEIRDRWKELQKTTFEGVALRERTTAHALDARRRAASFGLGREFDEHFNRFCAALTNAPTDIAFLLQRVRELEEELALESEPGQSNARPRLSAEARAARTPPRPEDLVGALQDRAHETSGRLLKSRPVLGPATEVERLRRIEAAARALKNSGYDGPFMGEPVAELFRALESKP